MLLLMLLHVPGLGCVRRRHRYSMPGMLLVHGMMLQIMRLIRCTLLMIRVVARPAVRRALDGDPARDACIQRSGVHPGCKYVRVLAMIRLQDLFVLLG